MRFETRMVYQTTFVKTSKDAVPVFHHSNVVDEFLCHSDNRYVGRTSQSLQQIKQRISKSILQGRIPLLAIG